MYDVSSRTVIVKSSTGEHVGPGTYVICSPRSRKRNCAPFLSSEEKSNSFISKFYTDALYDTRHCRNKIIGGGSLRNTAPRFVYKADSTPGPTRYNAKPIKCMKKKLKLDPTKPKLYVCVVPYSSTVVAPSIPSKVDENGYEIVHGDIVKLPPDKPPPNEICIRSLFCNGKGWKWSCRTSQRFDSKKYETCGPGPATYTLQAPKCRKDEEEERFREMARLLSFVPRYVEAQEMKAAKDSRPGPGYYDVAKDCSGHCSTYSKSIKPRPFIRAAPRFSSLTNDSPAPTKYNVCPCLKDKKFFSHKCAPFGNMAPRFTRKEMVETPGPASYEIKGALSEKLSRKRNVYALCDPPFNNTSVRSMSLVAKDAACTPSAADYPQLKDNEEEETMPVTSSVFLNNVCRFVSAHKSTSTEPAAYNITESFKKTKERKSFNVSEIPFRTTGPRSVIPQVKADVPCPTTYKKEIGLNCNGRSFNVSPRFQCPGQTPGPGDYMIHPRHENATYKAVDTHNLRLKENVLRKRLRQAPRETRKQWLKTMKQKKLLKWFDIELDYEERMIMLIQEVFKTPV